MKKAIGILLLLLANSVILAHAVIPHHHNSEIIVTVCDFFHHNDGCDNQDEGESAVGECFLNDLILRIEQDKEQNLSVSEINFLNHVDTYLALPAFYQEIEKSDGEQLPFRRKPYINSYHSHYVYHSLGLRAPPAC